MKIGILSTYPDKKCGVGYYTKQMVDELRISNRIDKIVVIGDLESSQADYLIDFKSFSMYKRIKEIIDKEQIDLLHIHHEYYLYGKSNLNFIILYYMLGCPKITKLSSLFSKNSGTPALERLRAFFVEMVVASKSKKVIVSTGASEDEIRNFPIEKVVQIPLGISKINTKRKKYQKNGIILFFGLVSAHKGIEYLIKSSRYLKNLKIIIAGKPNMDLSEINALKDEYSKYNKIIFDFAWISDQKRDEYFNNADLLVLPYTKIGFQSGVLYDALSYGIPCVVSAGGRMGAIVQEYNLGAAVNPIDPEDIAQGINEVLKDYEKFQNNVFRYQEIASSKNVAEMYIKLYNEVLSEDK